MLQETLSKKKIQSTGLESKGTDERETMSRTVDRFFSSRKAHFILYWQYNYIT